jgi:hypothetical protein
MVRRIQGHGKEAFLRYSILFVKDAWHSMGIPMPRGMPNDVVHVRALLQKEGMK